MLIDRAGVRVLACAAMLILLGFIFMAFAR
jgi:hypothetical protein